MLTESTPTLFLNKLEYAFFQKGVANLNDANMITETIERLVCRVPEQLLDVVAGFCRRFDEHDVELFGFSLALFRRHLTLVAQIGLVAHQHDYDITAALCSNVVDPLRGLEKWLEK